MEQVVNAMRPVIRLLRKKTFLALVFCLSFAYCMMSLYYGHRPPSGSYSIDYGDVDVEKTLGFRRGGLKEEVSEPGTAAGDRPERRMQDLSDILDYGNGSGGGLRGDVSSCRNSVQGKVLLADDRGHVCQRKEVRSSGCCDDISSRRYSCETCGPNHCCAIYEYCISCCMDPKQKELLTHVISGFSSSVVYASLTDHFEFCLAKCRTSSHSVQHENSYRDPKTKHCYGVPEEQKHS